MTAPLPSLALAAILVAGSATAQEELITRDRVGLRRTERHDLPLTAYDLYSSDDATREAYEALFTTSSTPTPAGHRHTDRDRRHRRRTGPPSGTGTRRPRPRLRDDRQLHPRSLQVAGRARPHDRPFHPEQVADLFPSSATPSPMKTATCWPGGGSRVSWSSTVTPVSSRGTPDLGRPQGRSVGHGRSGQGRFLFNGGRWEGTAFDWLPSFWAQGGELSTPTAARSLARARTGKFVAAVAYYADLVTSGAAPAA